MKKFLLLAFGLVVVGTFVAPIIFGDSEDVVAGDEPKGGTHIDLVE